MEGKDIVKNKALNAMLDANEALLNAFCFLATVDGLSNFDRQKLIYLYERVNNAQKKVNELTMLLFTLDAVADPEDTEE